MQRVDTVGEFYKNRRWQPKKRREKKRWLEADVGKENSRARKPSELQKKLHGKVKELLRQLQQGDKRLKDLGKVNDSLTEEIALKKTCEAVSWVSLERQGLAGGAAERLQEKNFLERNWLTKEKDAGKTLRKETNEEKEKQRRRMRPKPVEQTEPPKSASAHEEKREVNTTRPEEREGGQKKKRLM